MAGTINLAMMQQFDMDGLPLSGGKLFFFEAGTTAPRTPFQDEALTIVFPNPMVLDASGRVPMFYLADGHCKIRLEDKNGVTVMAADNLLVIGPSGGTSSSGSGFDPNAVIQTGNIIARFGTGPLTGYVRCNGQTIGPTGSGASELQGPTAEALFKYLWGTAVLPVTPTRGATAANDWDAGNKQIQLPDLRGRAIAGLDDMGATAANRLTSSTDGFGASATVLGNAGGIQSAILNDKKYLPPYTPTGTLSLGATVVPSGSVGISDTRSWNVPTNAGPVNSAVGVCTGSNQAQQASVAVTVGGAITAGFTGDTNTVSFGTATFNGTAQGGTSVAHINVPPSMVMTLYIKL